MRGAGVLALRARRVPLRGGDVVRGAPGLGGRGDGARHRSDASCRAGGRPARADRRRRQRVERLPGLPARPRSVHGLGPAGRHRCPGALEGPLPARDSYEPNDDAGRARTPSGGRSGGSRRASTSGTTRTTSTASGCGADSGSTQRSSGRAGPTRARGVASRDDRRRRPQQAGAERQCPARVGPNDFIGYRARRDGWYFLQVKLPTQGAGLPPVGRQDAVAGASR